MQMLRNVVIAGVVALLGTPSMPGAAQAADSRCWEPRRAEQGFTRLMNEARASAGAGRVTLDPELSRVARVHTREMVRTGTLHHTPDHLLRARVTNWVVLGENVGVGARVSSLHDAFMESAPHKANVLHQSFRYVGVGILRNDGRLWVTIIFEGNNNPGTSLRMPPC